MKTMSFEGGFVYREPPPLSSLILKIAGNCNLNCTYCYWFKKPGVRETLGNMEVSVVAKLICRLSSHISKYSLKKFHISLHGGEPLLFPKQRFISLCEDLAKIAQLHDCEIKISINTNATLIDKEWAEIFKKYIHNVGISIDGPKEINDKFRIDLRGKGSFDRVKNGVAILRAFNIDFGILCVAQAECSPRRLLETVVHEFNVSSFDVLIPDSTHSIDEKNVPKISRFYRELFDIWIDEYLDKGVKIRIFKNIMRLLLGFSSSVQTVGLGGVGTTMIMPDGKIEPLDVLHYLGKYSEETGASIFDSELQSVVETEGWLQVWKSSQVLPDNCRKCQFQKSCGGGHIVSRWSIENGFNNRSVYCEQLKEVFSHVATRMLEQSIVQ